MKKRSAEGGLPFLRGGHHGGFGRHHAPPLEGAAAYLGLTVAELRTQLMSGTSLAQVATAQGKSVDGLEKALAAEAKKRLDAAVKEGKLTQAQADELQARLTEHLDDLVNATGGRHRMGGRGMGGPGFGGPGMGGPGFGYPPPGEGQPPASFAPGAPVGAPV